MITIAFIKVSNYFTVYFQNDTAITTPIIVRNIAFPLLLHLRSPVRFKRLIDRGEEEGKLDVCFEKAIMQSSAVNMREKLC